MEIIIDNKTIIFINKIKSQYIVISVFHNGELLKNKTKKMRVINSE